MKLSRTSQGIAFMCLGTLLIPFMNASVKYLVGEQYPFAELVWSRYAFHLLLMLALFMPKKGWRLLHTKKPVIEIIRGLLLLGATSLYFVALKYISLPLALTISFTAPFIVTVLSVPMLREKVGLHRWIAVLIGLVGALIVIQPNVSDPNEAIVSWPAVLTLMMALLYAVYQILTRKIAGDDSSETAIVYPALVGVAAASLVAPFDIVLPRSAFDASLFVAMGLFGGLGHYFVIRAFHQAAAAVVSPFSYVQLIGSVILGFFIFGDFPDRWVWVGTAIIISGGLYTIWRERVSAHARDRAPTHAPTHAPVAAPAPPTRPPGS